MKKKQDLYILTIKWSKFEVYKLLVFSKIMGHYFNPSILNYTNRDF